MSVLPGLPGLLGAAPARPPSRGAPGPPPADPRNRTSGARPGRLRALLVGVGVAGSVLVLLALLCLDPADAPVEPAFWLVCALLLLTEVRPLFTAGTRDPVGLTLSTAFVFAVLLRYGLPAALVLQAAGTLLADVGMRKSLLRTWFNVGQFAVSWTAAAAVMHLLGHEAGLGEPLDLTSADLVAAAAGAVVYFLVNELLVDAAISALTGRSLREVARADLGYEVLTTAALLALAPLVCLAVERGAAFVPLLIPPLLAVYAVGWVALDRERRALTDPLTGLPNRAALSQTAAEDLQRGPLAVVLLDLDQFKQVNDTLGHHVGDRLLQVVAERLSATVRGCDTVARLGGDEFALVLPGLDDPAAAVEAVERLRGAVCEPVALDGMLVDIGASAGVALAPRHGTQVPELLRHADVAMYLAKDSRTVEVYDARRDRDSPGRRSALSELRRALDAHEVELRYRPAVSADGAAVRVQARLHWRDPELGQLDAAELPALGERAGLGAAVLSAVLDRALGQVARWRQQGLRLPVSVWVGDLRADGVPEHVAAALHRHRVPAELLQLEIPEAALRAEPARAVQALSRLAELGVGLGLAAVEAGPGTLAQLRHLPVRELTLHPSLVADVTDPAGAHVLRSLVGLAHGLGIRVAADEVPDADVARRLTGLGYDVLQGPAVGPPLPPDEVPAWLHQRPAPQRLGV